MAKPDTEDGWTPYAHELDAALAAADFTKGARIVLREVFWQTFGVGPVGKTKPRPAAISPSDIAQRWGLDKREVVRSLNHLVACRVLKRVDRGLYAFLKDYERWIWPDGSPRLSKVELSECAHAKALGKARKAAIGQTQNPGVQTVPGGESLGVQTVPGWGYELSPVGGMNCPQNGDSHYRSACAELEIRDVVVVERTTTTDARGVGTIADLIAQAATMFKPAVADVVRANAADIRDTLGDRLDCYLAALKQAKASRRPIGDLHAFCVSVAKKFVVNGIPPDPVSLEPEVPGKVSPKDSYAKILATMEDV